MYEDIIEKQKNVLNSKGISEDEKELLFSGEEELEEELKSEKNAAKQNEDPLVFEEEEIWERTDLFFDELLCNQLHRNGYFIVHASLPSQLLIRSNFQLTQLLFNEKQFTDHPFDIQKVITFF